MQGLELALPRAEEGRQQGFGFPLDHRPGRVVGAIGSGWIPFPTKG